MQCWCKMLGDRGEEGEAVASKIKQIGECGGKPCMGMRREGRVLEVDRRWRDRRASVLLR